MAFAIYPGLMPQDVVGRTDAVTARPWMNTGPGTRPRVIHSQCHPERPSTAYLSPPRREGSHAHHQRSRGGGVGRMRPLRGANIGYADVLGVGCDGGVRTGASG